jgi:hypothetical protein
MALRPEYDHLADATVTSAAVRRLPKWPARRSRSRWGAVLYFHRSVPLRASSVQGLCALFAGGVPSSHFHRPSAVLLRAVTRARTVRPDCWRRAISRRPGAGPTRAAVRAGAVRPEHDHIADATVTSAVVRRPPERPARRRLIIAASRPGAIWLLHRPSALLRLAPSGRRPGKGIEH